MFAKKIFVLLFISVFCAGAWQILPYLLDMKTVVAQSGTENQPEISATKPLEKTDAAKKDDVSPELKEKAVKLLKSVAEETQQFAAPPNRIKGQIAVANLLWEYDEPAARALFQNTLSELQELLNNLATVSDDKDTQENEDYSKRYALGEMRREYLLAIAAHDPKVALVALQSLRLQTTPSKQEYDPLKADELELQIASTVAKKDPTQAYDLAAKSLKDGVTYNTMATLTDLYKNNPEIGAKLARDILAKFKSGKVRPMIAANANSNMATASNGAAGNVGGSNSEANFIDFNEITQFMTTAAQLNNRAVRSQSDKKNPLLTDAEMRELADFIGQSFARQPAVEPWAIASTMPLITKYSPTAAQMIKRKLNQQQLQTLESYGDSGNSYEDNESKTADEIVADADKLATPSERDSRYAEAVHKLLEKDELEKAMEISGKIKDKTSNEYILVELEKAAPVIKARRGDVADVRKLLATMKSEDEKATTLTELVITLANKGEKEAAEKLMDEANQFLPARLKRKPNLETTLKIGRAYVLVQPERGFSLIENTIAQMNDLIAAGLMIDEFYQYGATEAEEILFDTMERQGALHTTDAVATIKNLAAVDFDRTVSLADKFARPEIRTYVRLKIAEALLDPEAAQHEKTLREQQSEREGD